jgi:phosphate transport system permease protein
MATPVGPGVALPRRPAVFQNRRSSDRIGDGILYGLCAFASVLAVVILGAIAYKVIDGATPAIHKFGFGFVTGTTWEPNRDVFGAGTVIYGTLVSSGMALLIATPLGIAIGLYLALLTTGRVRAVVGPLVEMLAAVPSVVLGLWGIFILGPFVRDHFDPWLKSWFGWIPIFSGTPQQAGLMPAILILAIMIVPITASVSRELFKSVPTDLKEGAYGLGLTRWEMVRGVIIPHTRGGLVAAVVLGMGRAVGEAIAVTQVIGGFAGIPTSLFQPGDTLASRIAAQYQGAVSNLHVASIVYLAVILLVFALLTNLAAQLIVQRFEFQKTGGG